MAKARFLSWAPTERKMGRFVFSEGWYRYIIAQDQIDVEVALSLKANDLPPLISREAIIREKHQEAEGGTSRGTIIGIKGTDGQILPFNDPETSRRLTQRIVDLVNGEASRLRHKTAKSKES